MEEQLLEKSMKFAKLELEENRKRELFTSIKKILEWEVELEQLNLDGLEPMFFVFDEQGLAQHKDEVVKDNTADEILFNAKQKKGNFFRVPKVVTQK